MIRVNLGFLLLIIEIENIISNFFKLKNPDMDKQKIFKLIEYFKNNEKHMPHKFKRQLYSLQTTVKRHNENINKMNKLLDNMRIIAENNLDLQSKQDQDRFIKH